MLRPKAAGKTRIILWTGRPGPDERAMSLDVECRGEGPDDGKWKCYQIVRERARDNHQLHAEILRKCFDCSAAKAASELALVLYNGGDYGKCAGLLTELTKETRYVMSEEALEKIVLAHCRDKKKFPVPCYLDYYTSAERWRTLVDTVKGMGVDDVSLRSLSF
ncbi:MAG: hypothetical protein M1305_07365, partial [Candidatus Marsarchaeota archaeon]|nr:hypothetical protein [Candidatus Marsarchaeota archaeon]